MRTCLYFLICICLFTKCTSKKATSNTFEDKQGNFKVNFYTEPIKEKPKFTFPFGTVVGTRYVVEKPDDYNESYSLLYLDLPKKVIHSDSLNALTNFFMFTQNDYLQSLGENNLSNVYYKKINGYPGREYVWANPNSKQMATRRVYLVENRLYILEVSYKFTKQHNKKIGSFFDSFELLKSKNNPHPEKEPELPTKNFNISFPGSTVTRNQLTVMQFGPQFLKIEMHQHDNGQSFDNNHNMSYSIVYTCIPKDSLNNLTTQQLRDYVRYTSRNNPLVTNGGQILKMSEGEFQGVWCLDFDVLIMGGKLCISNKTFVIENYQYSIMVMSEPGFERNSATINFMNSFKLLSE